MNQRSPARSGKVKPPHALKGQKLLAQGSALGNDGRKPVALKGQKLSCVKKFFLRKKSQSLIFY